MKNNTKISKNFIIFLDDEEKAVKYFEKIFSQYFNIIATSKVEEVMAIIDKKANEIAVIVSDQRMPNVNGVDLLALIKEKNPNITRILTTAYASLENNIDAINKSNIFGYIAKPWNIEEAKTILTNAIEEFETRQNYLGLSGSIAHEMRNPLNNVRQSTKFVREKLAIAKLNERFCGKDAEKITPLTQQDYEEIFSHIDIADNSAKRGNAVIDIILNNIKGKKIDESDFKDLSIFSVIKNSVDEYGFRENEKDRLSLKLDENQDFVFKGDETSIIYIFFNLLKNSLYYASSKQDLAIEIRCEIGDDNFNRVYFKDNGPGISADKLKNIFDNFATSGKKEGTGLGLSFCKRSMNSVGGNILCNSKLNEFCEFILEFPKKLDLANLSPSNKILLVLNAKNQNSDIVFLKNLLEKELLSTLCKTALNLDEAVLQARKNKYQAILVDVKNCDIDEISAVKELTKFNQETPIIAYLDSNSSQNSKFIDQLKNLGFCDFISENYADSKTIKTLAKWAMIKINNQIFDKNNITNLLQNKRILLADDEETNLMITAKYLSSFKAIIDKARDGKEVLAMIKKTNYDLILMDIQMPNIDGITAVFEIRKFQKENSLNYSPIIAITGDNSISQIYKILSAGFDDYFIKGNDYDNLLKNFDTLIC